MKKPKISLDSAKLQAFFMQHVEKMLLVLIVGVTLFLVYQGFSMSGLESNRTPKGLLETSQSMMQFINDPNRWNQVKAEREVFSEVSQDAVKDQIRVDANQYFLPFSWNKPDFPKLSPRQDPELFAPIHLVVRPIVGPLAYLQSEGFIDPLQPPPSEDGEAPAPKKKAKPKPKPKAKAPPGMDPMGAAQPRGRKGRGGGEDVLGGGAMGMDIGVGMEMDAAAGTGIGMGMGMGMESSAPGKVNPEAIRGFTATAAEARNTQAVVVMALVPYEKQVQEFEKALLDSLDFNAQRDMPLYLKFFIERADVTDNPDVVDPTALKWDPVSVTAVKEETFNWAGSMNEVVDPSYIDAALTHPAPPFMQRDLWDILAHPELPLPALASTDAAASGLRPVRPKPSKAPAASDEPTLDDLLNPQQRGGQGGMGAPAGMGMPAVGGAAASVGGPAFGMDAAAGMGGADGMGGGDAMGYGSSYGSGLPRLPPAKYKLIRFTDVTVESGRKYRYHVRVLLHDPNHPAPGIAPPSLPSLDPTVRERIRPLAANQFWRFSEWSEPSPVAELPAPDSYYAGSVTQPTTIPLIPGKPQVPNTLHPFGKSLVVVWDGTKVVDVAAEVEVHRGSLLNFQQETLQVIHPVDHRIVELTDYVFGTDSIVADMMGGDEIPVLDRRNEKPPLMAPGEILIIDSRGKLHVQNETDDIEGYRIFHVTEPEESNAAPGQPGGMPAAGFGGILESAPMPGVSP